MVASSKLYFTSKRRHAQKEQIKINEFQEASREICSAHKRETRFVDGQASTLAEPSVHNVC